MEKFIFEKPLFGKEIKIIIKNIDKTIAEDILEEAYEKGLQLQKIFNFYDKKSELSILNKKRKINASQELISVIKKAIEMSPKTNAKYDITLGKEILARKNNKKEKSNSSYKDIEISDNQIILKNPESMIDLGSIAKGYITDKIAEFLKKSGIKEFIIDSRGDIIISGQEIIEIQHPRKNKAISKIKIKNKAIATSGDYNQFHKTYKKSHILNSNKIISATVIADTLEKADLYATALFVSDEKQRKELLKKENISAMTIDQELKIKMYKDFKEFIYEN